MSADTQAREADRASTDHPTDPAWAYEAYYRPAIFSPLSEHVLTLTQPEVPVPCSMSPAVRAS